MRSIPKNNRWNSEQVVVTPDSFMFSVVKRFGEINFDLAATKENSKARDAFFRKEQDSLSQEWKYLGGVLWLNPPFGDITPWAKKCAETPMNPRRRILLLTPLSTAQWACKYCHGVGYVLGLAGRVRFEGHSADFPKDLMLTVYDGRMSGFDVWDWRKESP